MKKLARYLTPDESAQFLKGLADELHVREMAVVTNLEYVYARFELYPLAPKITHNLDCVVAYAVDMDGTSTTTEPLALHSLEYMVRRFTGRPSKAGWPGLDPQEDYPFVIGSSNFRHTEFLINRYGRWLDNSALCSSFIESLLWTLSAIEDAQRVNAVRLNAVNCGLGCLLDDPEFKALVGEKRVDEANVSEAARPFVEQYGVRFRCDNPVALVSAALDIYYARYHSILRQVAGGGGERLSEELLGQSGRRLIEPMPGYAVFLALIKGWLGDAAGQLWDDLRSHLAARQIAEPPGEEEGRAGLVRLSHRFREHPAKIALVTASIAYEAHAVIAEVFTVLREEVAASPIADSRKQELLDKFCDYWNVYDGLVTASDSSEARLKPHRDLYTMALYQMGIAKEDYARCVGLEDTEPGIIALRAAGVGCAVALPNRDTQNQDYSAAGRIVRGGLPELILCHNAMLTED